MTVYVITNDNGMVVSVHATSLSAKKRLEEIIMDEKYVELSKIMRTACFSQKDKNARISNLSSIYNDTLDMLDRSYEYYLNNPGMDRFSCCEWCVSECEVEEDE